MEDSILRVNDQKNENYNNDVLVSCIWIWCNNINHVTHSFFQTYVSGQKKLNMNDATRNYYAHDMVKSGILFIVSKMCASQFKNDTDLYSKVTDTEIDFQICLSRFTNNLTKN